MDNQELDGQKVKIIRCTDGCTGFVGEAVLFDDGWLRVDLSVQDPEDDRMFGPYNAEDLEVLEDDNG